MTEEARSPAEALFVRKEKQRIEGIGAMADYLRGQEKELANLARLRAMRLDRERRESSQAPGKTIKAAPQSKRLSVI